MPEFVVHFLRRARRCPLACAMKVLFLLLFLVALDLALYHLTEISPLWYVLFVGFIALVAALMLYTGNDCRIRHGEFEG